MSSDVPVPDPVPPSPGCRLVSYNVLYQSVSPEGHSWADRRESVLAELDRLGPDVIAFQEVWTGQFDDLRDGLDEFSWVAATDAPVHTPIAYRADRFEAVESGTFWLSPPDAEPGAPAWDAAYERLATYTVLFEAETDASLTVTNVHLDHEGEKARQEGIALARQRLTDAAKGPAVLAGDFNCRPGDPAHRQATVDRDAQRSLTDATALAGEVEGPAETYTGFPEEDYQPQDIDHVLVSPELDVERVVTCVPPGETDRRPSDHRPVLADFAY
jgi:endonuclease/exonuclease/phosphatase family metal-dependent hydrolase